MVETKLLDVKECPEKLSVVPPLSQEGGVVVVTDCILL